jgi:hypothetical protein
VSHQDLTRIGIALGIWTGEPDEPIDVDELVHRCHEIRRAIDAAEHMACDLQEERTAHHATRESLRRHVDIDILQAAMEAQDGMEARIVYLEGVLRSVQRATTSPSIQAVIDEALAPVQGPGGWS